MFPVTFILVLMTFRNMAFLMAVATAMVAKAQTERKMTVDDLFQLVESNSGSWLWDNIWKSSSLKIVSR